MSEPLIDPDELGTYLGDDSVNVDRAVVIIADAQAACEAVVYPVPAGKLYVLRRVAMRAYLAGGGQARGYQLQQAGADQAMPSPMSGVYLTAKDQADLLSNPATDDAATGTSAFTIKTTPAVTVCQPWGSIVGRW